MKIDNLLFICLIVLSLNLNAQQNENQLIFDKYKSINIDFFTDNNTLSDKKLYKALKARIQGDNSAYRNLMEQVLYNIKNKELKNELAVMLFYDYLDNYERGKAVDLNRDLGLDMNVFSNVIAKKSDYPKPKIASKSNQTEVDFKQFYFEALIGNNDTIKVFFDTGAPGTSINKDIVEKYNWTTDTTYYGFSVLPALDMKFKNYPVLIPSLRIGDFKIQNLPAKFSNATDSQKKKIKNSGIEEYDILIGLNVFKDLLSGVEFDYKNETLRLFKSLPKKDVSPNFMFADAKPAIQFKLSKSTYAAFLDTGSPRHVLPDQLITEENSFFKKKGNYGDFQYDIFYLKYDQVLNLKNVWLDTADYGGFKLSGTFRVNGLFGSFLNRSLFFDLKNRHVKILKN